MAYDVALNYGNTSAQAIEKMKRLLLRAAIRISTEKNRRWSWLVVTKSFNTIAGEDEYALSSSVKAAPSIFFVKGSNKRKLRRIPSRSFIESVPDRSDDSGNPTFYDFEGVNSNGCRVVSLWPTPSGVEEIFYRGKRVIQPIVNDEADIRAAWGMPEDVIEALIEYATALAWKGMNDSRYQEQMGEAQELLDRAYAADQENVDTKKRAPMIDGEVPYDEDIQLPARFGV